MCWTIDKTPIKKLKYETHGDGSPRLLPELVEKNPQARAEVIRLTRMDARNAKSLDSAYECFQGFLECYSMEERRVYVLYENVYLSAFMDEFKYKSFKKYAEDIKGK